MTDIADKIAKTFAASLSEKTAKKVASSYLLQEGTPTRVAARFVERSAKAKTFPEARKEIQDFLRSKHWKLSPDSLKVPHATSPDGDVRLWFKPQAVYVTEGNAHNLGAARTMEYDLDIRKLTPQQFLDKVEKYYGNKKSATSKEAEGLLIGPQGLEKPETGIALQKGAMYGFGASSMPTRVVLTLVSDDKVKYKVWPFQGPDKTVQTWIAKDLLTKGTRTLLKNYGPNMDKKLRSSMESLLSGGKGRKEKLEDYAPVTVEAVAADPSQDLWRAAEQYGNVAGSHSDKGMTYEIDTFQRNVSEIKKDKRFEVVDVKPRKLEG